jgi:hypothetical protein
LYNLFYAYNNQLQTSLRAFWTAKHWESDLVSGSKKIRMLIMIPYMRNLGDRNEVNRTKSKGNEIVHRGKDNTS